MLAGEALQRKLINLSEIINNDISCENKDHRYRKHYKGNFFCHRISLIGRHLPRHCLLPPSIPMAVCGHLLSSVRWFVVNFQIRSQSE